MNAFHPDLPIICRLIFLYKTTVAEVSEAGILKIPLAIVVKSRAPPLIINN